MPKEAKELTKQFQIEQRKGTLFAVGGIKGLWCDYRRSVPSYFVQWKKDGKRKQYFLHTSNL
ncbi:MAG: hypothetical protein IJ022_04560, partial [Burkholderiaceae bacterium]|nr:hypothetical protein [Burkholderiaceae bacterium]